MVYTKKVQCRLCDWEWLPRVETPSSCPRCKRHDWSSPTTKMSRDNPIKSKFMVNKAKETLFVSGGLRTYREYRDFGIGKITEGKVRVHIIRTTTPCPEGGSGLHYHDIEFQMVYCMKGNSTVWFEDFGEQRFEEGDCWVQPPKIKHNVLHYSDDYQVMELTIPADYETIQLDKEKKL